MSNPSTSSDLASKRHRRTLQERLEANLKERKALEAAAAVKLKSSLENLAKDVQSAALSVSGKAFAGDLGQAANLITKAANTIKLEQ